MKRVLVLAFAFLPVSIWAQSVKFTVNAKIGSGSAPERAYLIYKQADNIIRDSVAVHNGEFQFTGALSEPAEAHLVLDHEGVGLAKLGDNADYRVVYLEQATINITSKDSVKSAAITGSKLNDDNAAYTAIISKPEKSIADLNSEYTSAPDITKHDPNFTAGLQVKGEKLLAERKKLQKQFISQHPQSYMSLLILMEISRDKPDLKVMDSLYKGLSPQIQNLRAGQTLGRALHAAHSTTIGAEAPDFTLNDVNDKPVSLKDFRGKYVLIDFWASWCAPCRQENPGVVKSFNKYKDKNFTVLGVSLDRPGKKADWLAAIKDDGLTWTQVSDLKFWGNAAAVQYNITAIPQNYLIDPTGKIIGENLHGEELNAKLASLFN